MSEYVEKDKKKVLKWIVKKEYKNTYKNIARTVKTKTNLNVK